MLILYRPSRTTLSEHNPDGAIRSMEMRVSTIQRAERVSRKRCRT
jgi:hypothetical protein